MNDRYELLCSYKSSLPPLKKDYARKTMVGPIRGLSTVRLQVIAFERVVHKLRAPSLIYLNRTHALFIPRGARG